MATLNEITHNIINIARSGISNDNDRLNSSQVKFWIRYYRAKLVFEFTNAGKNIDPQLLQDMGCITLTSVDKARCPVATWGENIKHTTLPKIVDLPYNRALVFVGLTDKQTPIPISNAGTVHFARHNRFTSDIMRAYLIGSELYIDIPDTLKEDVCYINVRGVFEDPQLVSICDEAGACVCLQDDDEYPLPARMIDMITEMILTKEIRFTASLPSDEYNNARQDSITPEMVAGVRQQQQ
tara:strand:+ start:2270 stop:2986 length:717 start_codon:yes stop_codon:yes gene_type:complete